MRETEREKEKSAANAKFNLGPDGISAASRIVQCLNGASLHVKRIPFYLQGTLTAVFVLPMLISDSKVEKERKKERNTEKQGGKNELQC